MTSDIRLDEKTRNQLIELVKERPALYMDCSDRSVEQRDERQKLWDEVAKRLDVSGNMKFFLAFGHVHL